MRIATLWFVLCVGVLPFVVCEFEVELGQGVVKGHAVKSYREKDFMAFEGIPYAKPPVGELRFAPPVPADKWEGVLEGNKRYTCSQLLPIPSMWGPTGTEDCLYLYVHVPGNEIKKDAKLPVIVHIHGGAFMLGSPRVIALPDYIMDQDVIFVTMNYRVGILGFLSTEDEVVQGNMGLKDQNLALKWIKDNIENFGGDSQSITITGHSAGGASVQYHYLSPLSQGLFARGFSMSGTALQPWALTENPLEKAKFVARNVSCETDSTEKMVACLRTKSDEELILGIDGLFVMLSGLPCTPFGPVIEKVGVEKFLHEHPYKLLKEGKVYDAPWINSNVQDEGIFPVGFFVHLKKMDYIANNWDTLMPGALDMNDTVEESMKVDVVNKVKKFYFQDKPINDDSADIFIRLYNDRFYFIDSMLATRLHAKAISSPVYYYFFKFLPESNFRLLRMKPGVSHGLDDKLMFKWIIFPDLKENEEKMMILFIDFLKKYGASGIPEIGGVKWDPVAPGSEEINYLEINSPEDIQMNSVKEFGEKEFWDSLPIKENNHLYD